MKRNKKQSRKDWLMGHWQAADGGFNVVFHIEKRAGEFTSKPLTKAMEKNCCYQKRNGMAGRSRLKRSRLRPNGAPRIASH
jgi:hypothetical protein